VEVEYAIVVVGGRGLIGSSLVAMPTRPPASAWGRPDATSTTSINSGSDLSDCRYRNSSAGSSHYRGRSNQGRMAKVHLTDGLSRHT
jgi:hypothetical protein